MLRLAVPARHAATEKKDSVGARRRRRPTTPAPPRRPGRPTGRRPAFLGHLAAGGAPRAVWSAAPGTDWPRLVAHAVAATVASGRGALVVVPDGKDVARVDAALTAVLGADQHVVLTADAGPAKRYRDFLAVSRGRRRVVVGTRAAAFAPVAGLGLVVIWDDGDDLHAEPRAPYPHAREVLLLRAEREGAAALVGGFAMSVEAEQLVRTGWAHLLAASRGVLRERVTDLGGRGRRARAGPRPAGPGDPGADRGRTARSATRWPPGRCWCRPRAAGTPRRWPASGAAPRRAAGSAPGRWRSRSATAPPTCRWCGTADEAWACPECGHRGLRAPVRGGDPDRRGAGPGLRRHRGPHVRR